MYTHTHTTPLVNVHRKNKNLFKSVYIFGMGTNPVYELGVLIKVSTFLNCS